MDDKEVELVVKRFGKIEGKYKLESIEDFQPIFKEELKKEGLKMKKFDWISVGADY